MAEPFLVSARKYRPSAFESVVGQEHITTTLTNAIEKKQLAQAMLFCGPRGVGKTTCARIVAKMINKFDETGQDSATAMNIYELDAASNNSVEDIRNLVDQVRYPPQNGEYKVYIIDEVHMLSNAAFNAFLKTLEEPPSYAIFILATTEKHKIIPTILSRCQIFDFNRISVSRIVDHLKDIAEKESISADEDALHLIASKADGALRDALSIFDTMANFAAGETISLQSVSENLHILDYDYYFSITEALAKEQPAEALLIFDEILKKGFDGHHFTIGLSEHFRNLMVCKDPRTIQLLEVSPSVQQKYGEQAKASDMAFLLTGIDLCATTDINYKSSKNQRLLVELLLIKLAHVPQAISIEEIAKKKD